MICAVLERAGLGLVGVDDEVRGLDPLVGGREEARLATHREPGAATTADVGGEQLLEHLGRLHHPRALQLHVAADGAIVVHRGQVAAGLDTVEDDAGLVSHRPAAPRRSPARPPA